MTPEPSKLFIALLPRRYAALGHRPIVGRCRRPFRAAKEQQLRQPFEAVFFKRSRSRRTADEP
jgi:hypothetical protein